MKKLWIAFIVLATLGSIYPFDFQAAELNLVTIGEFLRTCCRMSSRGDILGNTILFVPIGFTGTLVTRSESSASRRFLFVCFVGAIVALALQVMQIFLPSRDENLQDVIWNVFGTAGGAALASLIGVFSSPSEGSRTDVSLVPLTLVATWLFYRLIPFVPSLDLQLIKDSLKPVMQLRLAPVSIIHDVTAWVVIAYLLRHAQRGARLDKHLPVLIITVFCLEVLIVDNSINLANVVGAILAVLLWWGVLRHIRRQEHVLVILLLFTLAVMGLAPFDFRTDPVPFNWFPFHGFLGGSMYLNTQSAAEKVFLYGSLVFLLWRTNFSVFGSIFFAFSFVAIVEFAQMYFAGHTPEITDPLLVIFAAIALLALARHEEQLVLVGQPDTSSLLRQPETAAKAFLRSRSHHKEWVNQSINLRGYQFDFLARLSQEMEISVSRVTRRIVAQFIEGLEQDADATPGAAAERLATVGSTHDKATPEPRKQWERWTNQSVNLRGYQFDFLLRLSQEMGISVSRATRRIIAHFIDGLD